MLRVCTLSALVCMAFIVLISIKYYTSTACNNETYDDITFIHLVGLL